MTRCVQDFVALGSENCNAALCLSSGSWITSSLRKIDFAAIFILNLIQKNTQSSYASLWYHVKTEHAIERQIWSDASQIPPAKRTKVQSSFFFLLHWWEEEPGYDLCCARCRGLLIFQPDFNKEFHQELNAAEILGSSYFSYDHPCKGEGVQGGCKRRYCKGS